MVKCCTDDYSIQNHRNYWWRNIFCVDNIHGKATLCKNLLKKMTFRDFLQILEIHPPPPPPPIVSMVSSLPCPNLHLNIKNSHSNALLSLPRQLKVVILDT